MPVTYPMPATDFMDVLRAPEMTLYLDRPRQHNFLGGGELISAELAPPYWNGQVSLPAMSSRRADDLAARLEGLEVPGRGFFAYHAHRIGPRADPLGAGLTGFAPVLADVDTGTNERIRLAGLPLGYYFQRGDLLAFDYDPGTGTRRAFHRVSEARYANISSGSYTDYEMEFWMTVAPHIRPGWSLGAAVNLVRPTMLAALVPGSIDYGASTGSVVSGMGFSFRQKLRV